MIYAMDYAGVLGCGVFPNRWEFLVISKLDIAIIGAGIAGLTLAVALRKLGMNAVIYEQTPRFSRVGAAIQLTPYAVRVLRGLGIEEHHFDRIIQKFFGVGRLNVVGLDVHKGSHDTGIIVVHPFRREIAVGAFIELDLGSGNRHQQQ